MAFLPMSRLPPGLPPSGLGVFLLNPAVHLEATLNALIRGLYSTKVNLEIRSMRYSS